MDPRQARSREALEGAIVALARENRLEAITASEVAAAAGVSRPTFYAHAKSPADLLGQVMGRTLRELVEGVRARTPEGQIAIIEAERSLVAHVREYADIYRRNLPGRLPGGLRDVLIDHLESNLRDFLERHPEVMPAPIREALREQETAMYAAICASGVVAGLETWLAGPDLADDEWAVRVIIEGTASWWRIGAAV
ncbi:MAG: hypothetical protein JWP66_1996 [Naasia sp.]|nr:hypothetical protein [Naasia sp.]